MSQTGRDGDVRYSQETLCRHLGDFQTVEFGRFCGCENLLYCLARRLFEMRTEGGSIDLTGHEEKGPTCSAEFSIQFQAVQILDPSPSSQIRLAFDLQAFRENNPFLDQN